MSDLISVIIPCCNQLTYTKLCIESVLRHSREPFELIVVDNGSTDGTKEYLAAVPHGKIRCGFADNRGFAIACNEGMRAASGKYLVLLNNDTIVTDGWLEGLTDCDAGLAGPVSNCARGVQQIPVNYGHVNDIGAFAAKRRTDYAGRFMQTDRLGGFCLMIRRDVYERIGGLDERFGLGFFEDDDYCVRALHAGFLLNIALDVFIHHFGNKTIEGLGIDARALMTENLERFRDKWGDVEAGRYDSPSPTVSLTMIVKNEAHNLTDCLESVQGLVNEIIVVDTGSSDDTREIALRNGAKVFDFPWCDSFAAARNEAVRRATGDWCLWLDADDRIDEENREKLRLALRSPQAMAFRTVSETHDGFCEAWHVRVFHRTDGWVHRVHEYVNLPGAARRVDVTIRHVGYQNRAAMLGKCERNLKLLLAELKDDPTDQHPLEYMGPLCLEMGRLDEAVAWFKAGIPRVNRDVRPRLVIGLIRCLIMLGKNNEAFRLGVRWAAEYPDDPEIVLTVGGLYMDEKEYSAAEELFRHALKCKPPRRAYDPGANSYRARFNLALCLYRQGNHAAAVEELHTIVLEYPDFKPARAALDAYEQQAPVEVV